MQSGQLILTKISKVGASKCQTFRLKCASFYFHWGSASCSSGGAYSAPQTCKLLYLKSLIKGKKGEGNEGAGDRGVGNGDKGDMSPRKFHAENFRGFLVNTLLQWLLAYMSSASGGFVPRPHQGSAPGPAGRLLSPVPRF